MADQKQLMLPLNEFWVTNISKLNVSIRDLGIHIPPKKTINLLAKGFRFTEEQVLKSFESGSLFQKKDKIVKSTRPLVKKPKQMLVCDIPRDSIINYPNKIEKQQSLLDEIDSVSEESVANQFSND